MNCNNLIGGPMNHKSYSSGLIIKISENDSLSVDIVGITRCANINNLDELIVYVQLETNVLLEHPKKLSHPDIKSSNILNSVGSALCGNHKDHIFNETLDRVTQLCRA